MHEETGDEYAPPTPSRVARRPRLGCNLVTAAVVLFGARATALAWADWMIVHHPINGSMPIDELAITWEWLPFSLLLSGPLPGVWPLVPLLVVAPPIAVAVWWGRWSWLLGIPASLAYFFWAALWGLLLQ